MTLGGRSAEEIVFSRPRPARRQRYPNSVTDTAKRMVMRYGMSRNKTCPCSAATPPTCTLPRAGHGRAELLDEQREIDDEVRRIIEDGHELALRVLREHLDELHRISQILIERETIDKDQFARLVGGESEDDVFMSAAEPRRRRSGAARRLVGCAYPLPGSAMQTEPEGAS